MASQILLGRLGCTTTLHIGVAQCEGGKLLAHAWVEGESGVIVGGIDNLAHFVRLPPLERASK
jgi:hypothetical protein